MIAVVHNISPQNTELCWVMRKVENITPNTSIKYLAESPNSIFKARRNMNTASLGHRVQNANQKRKII